MAASGYTPHLEHRYLYGQATDEILASENASGAVLWGLGDHEGTIRDIVGNVALGAVGNGVAAQDAATGTGFILYSVESVWTRFSANPPETYNSDHLISVKYINGQWCYDNNYGYYAFTPRASDVLVAAVDFTNDTITGLQGVSAVEQGIVKGYAAGDLTFAANLWGGVANPGEFLVQGTYFIRNDQQSDHRKYDSFGKMTSESAPATDFIFGYTGQALDKDTGLIDFGHRPYDPAVARFPNEDPSGFSAGDMNLYRYVGNDPLNNTDPSGLCNKSNYGFSGALSGSINMDAVYRPNSLSMNQLGQGYQASQNAAYYQEASRYMDAGRAAQFRENAQPGSVAWAGVTGFGSGVAQTFSNGQAWDSVQGAGVGIFDSGADLAVAGANEVRRAGVDTRNFFTGDNLAYSDWQRSGRLSDYVSPLYGNGQAYSQGMVVGDYTVRADVVAAVGWTGANALVAAPGTVSSLYGAGSGMFGSATLGGGSALAFSPSAVGGIATVGVSSTAVAGVATGFYNSGAAEPLSNWFFASGQNASGGTGSYTNTHESGKTYSGKGSPGRMQDSASRIAKEHGDPVVQQEHAPAADTKQSFIEEQNRIEANGGPGGNTYNKINSPGKKLRDGH